MYCPTSPRHASGRWIGRFFLGRIDPPSMLTLLSIVLSCTAVILTEHGRLELGAICLMYAGLCDLFDGWLARKLRVSGEAAELGKQLDSLADMASFGVVPPLLIFAAGLRGTAMGLAAVFYACCAAIRLAHFNVHGTIGEGSGRYYTGLPVTYAALVFPLVLYVCTSPAMPPEGWPLQLSLWAVGMLFIVRIPVPKPRGAAYAVFVALAVVLTTLWLHRLAAHPPDAGANAHQFNTTRLDTRNSIRPPRAAVRQALKSGQVDRRMFSSELIADRDALSTPTEGLLVRGS